MKALATTTLAAALAAAVLSEVVLVVTLVDLALDPFRSLADVIA